jgi:hypothetical protein
MNNECNQAGDALDNGDADTAEWWLDRLADSKDSAMDEGCVVID